MVKLPVSASFIVLIIFIFCHDVNSVPLKNNKILLSVRDETVAGGDPMPANSPSLENVAAAPDSKPEISEGIASAPDQIPEQQGNESSNEPSSSGGSLENENNSGSNTEEDENSSNSSETDDSAEDSSDSSYEYDSSDDSSYEYDSSSSSDDSSYEYDSNSDEGSDEKR